MTRFLRQSTAASIIAGPFLSTSDGYTSKEAFTSLSGISFKNSASAAVNPAALHTASGYYNVPLDAGSTGTLGRLRLAFSNSACHLPVWEDYEVVTGSTYDALVAGTDRLAAELAASGITASVLAADSIHAAAIAASSFTAAAFAASSLGREAVSVTAATKIADVTLQREWGDAASSTDGSGAVFRSLLGAVAKQVNAIDATGASLVIYEADDTTAFGSQTITACDAASPIVALNTD